MNRMILGAAAAVCLAGLSGQASAQQAAPVGVAPVASAPAPAPTPEEQIARLQARLAQSEQALANHRILLAQARADGALKDELLILGRTRNAELYQIASQILDRYAGMGVPEALVRREPFVQAARVDLENRVQDYEDRLRAARIDETTLAPSVERRMDEELARRRAEAAAAEPSATPAQ